MKMRRRAIGLVVVVLFAFTACGRGGDGLGSDLGASKSDDTSTSAEDDVVPVLAPPALKAQLTSVMEAFEDETGIRVDVEFLREDELAARVTADDRAGLYVDTRTPIVAAESAGKLAEDRSLLGYDVLQIVVPPTNPAGVTGLAAFGDVQVATALCPVEKWCGQAARAVLNEEGIASDHIQTEPDVGPLLDRIVAGDVSATILWRTDVAPRGDTVLAIEIPDELNRRVNYLMAPLNEGEDAAALSTWLNGVKGSAALREVGLLPAA
jgi:molybdate transport system substrate-binding protein